MSNAPRLKVENLLALPERQRLEEMVKAYNALQEQSQSDYRNLKDAFFHDLELDIPPNTITYQNSWASSGGTARFYRDAGGMVSLEVKVTNTGLSASTTSSVVLTLPVGFRPEATLTPGIQEVEPQPWNLIADGSMTSSWVNFGSGTFQAAYRKYSSGRVRMRGSIKNGTFAASFFTIPAGYRIDTAAGSDHSFPLVSPSVSPLPLAGAIVRTNGNVDIYAAAGAGTTNAIIDIVGIDFHSASGPTYMTVGTDGQVTIVNPVPSAIYGIHFSFKAVGAPLPFSRSGGVLFETPFKPSKVVIADCRNRETQAGLLAPNLQWSPVRRGNTWQVKVDDMPGVEADTKYKISFMVLP